MRTLIEENPIHLERFLNQFKEYQPLLKAVKEKYESLGAEFTVDVWHRIRSGEVESLRSAYFAGIHEELDRSGIRNRILRDNALKGIERPFQEFEEAVEKLINHRPRAVYGVSGSLEISDISYHGNEFIITDEDKEAIAEKYTRIYLEDDEISQELFKLATVTAESVSKLFKLAEQANTGNRPNWFNIGGLAFFIRGEKTEWKPNIHAINMIARQLNKQKA